MSPTEIKILLVLATAGGVTVVAATAICILRARDAIRGLLRRARLVKLEDIAIFAKPGCILCHKAGVIQRRPHPHAPAMTIPCGCASRRFLNKHAGDVEQLGGQVLWKRGHKPHALHADARRDAGGAAA
jgi:hypothetical protein